MADDILSGYGPGSSQPQRAPASNGGRCDPKDVMNYSPPQGPKGIMESQTPGLHGTNSGTTNRPTSLQRPSGSPGIGGTVRPSGTQGRY